MFYNKKLFALILLIGVQIVCASDKGATLQCQKCTISLYACLNARLKAGDTRNFLDWLRRKSLPTEESVTSVLYSCRSFGSNGEQYLRVQRHAVSLGDAATAHEASKRALESDWRHYLPSTGTGLTLVGAALVAGGFVGYRFGIPKVSK